MPNVIDRAGQWKAIILDFGVSTTSKRSLPQFVAQFKVTHLYDAETEAWLDAAAHDFVDIGYFVITTTDAAGKAVPCFAYDSLMRTFDWDGESYSGLANGKYRGMEVQIRTAANEWDGVTRYKIEDIAPVDASVGLRKLSAEGVADLDKKFNLGRTKVKPASAPIKPTTAPKVALKAAPKVSVVEEALAATTTEDAAWAMCLEANHALGEKSVPNEVLGDYWTGAVQELAVLPAAPTDEEWIMIQKQVLISIDTDIDADCPF